MRATHDRPLRTDYTTGYDRGTGEIEAMVEDTR